MRVRVSNIKYSINTVAWLALLVALIGGLFFISSDQSDATQQHSWIQGTPVLSDDYDYRQENYQAYNARMCTTRSVPVAGVTLPQRKCVTAGNNTYIDSGLEYIKVGDDQQYYRMHGMYNSVSVRRSHVPSTNMLVTRSGYTHFTYSATLTIEKDILSSLSPVNYNPGVREYLYEHNPDFTLSDGNGPLSVARGLEYSDNGRWLVVELMGLGLARIDLHNNYRVELFSTLAPSYYFGLNPSMIFAISDDGSHVAVGGGNTPFMIYQIDNTCTKLIDPNEAFSRTGYDGCQGIWLGEVSGLTGQYQYPGSLEFGESNYELHFREGYAPGHLCGGDSETNCETWRTIHAAGYANEAIPRLKYLALGDSYSSGEGDVGRNPHGDKYYRYQTDIDGDSTTPREKCHISTQSYPYILARGMNLALDSPREWNTVACSGATAWDVKRQGTEHYMGQNLTGSGPERLHGFDNALQLKAEALNEFIPGRQKQIEFVRKYKPEVITLTMGGNDIGFGDKLSQCANPLTLPSTCRYATQSGSSALAGQIAGQY